MTFVIPSDCARLVCQVSRHLKISCDYDLALPQKSEVGLG
jgi:hypothetical protein